MILIGSTKYGCNMPKIGYMGGAEVEKFKSKVGDFKDLRISEVVGLTFKQRKKSARSRKGSGDEAEDFDWRILFALEMSSRRGRGYTRTRVGGVTETSMAEHRPFVVVVITAEEGGEAAQQTRKGLNIKAQMVNLSPNPAASGILSDPIKKLPKAHWTASTFNHRYITLLPNLGSLLISPDLRWRRNVNLRSWQMESGDEEESGDELEETSSEESESEPEAEQPQGPRKASIPTMQREAQVQKKASTLATPKSVQSQASAKTQQTSSSSEEETGSESESDGPDHMLLDNQKSNIRLAVPPRFKPSAADEAATPAAAPRSKSSAAEAATPTASKRPAEDREGEVARDSKKAKKKGDTPDESKKLLFQRLWSEDDEIAILNGMIEYSNKKKADPVADLNAFHEFIKKNLHVEVSRSQLQDKIRRLRKKHGNNKSKEKDGKDRTFSKPHEQKAYELSKVIWGGGKDGGETGLGSSRGNVSAVKKTPMKTADNEEAGVGNLRIGEGNKVCASDSGLSVEGRIMKAGAELFETGKGIEGEKEWKKLRVEEIELFVKQTEVKLAQSRLVLNALKST